MPAIIIPELYFTVYNTCKGIFQNRSNLRRKDKIKKILLEKKVEIVHLLQDLNINILVDIIHTQLCHHMFQQAEAKISVQTFRSIFDAREKTIPKETKRVYNKEKAPEHTTRASSLDLLKKKETDVTQIDSSKGRMENIFRGIAEIFKKEFENDIVYSNTLTKLEIDSKEEIDQLREENAGILTQEEHLDKNIPSPTPFKFRSTKLYTIHEEPENGPISSANSDKSEGSLTIIGDILEPISAGVGKQSPKDVGKCSSTQEIKDNSKMENRNTIITNKETDNLVFEHPITNGILNQNQVIASEESKVTYTSRSMPSDSDARPELGDSVEKIPKAQWALMEAATSLLMELFDVFAKAWYPKYTANPTKYGPHEHNLFGWKYWLCSHLTKLPVESLDIETENHRARKKRFKEILDMMIPVYKSQPFRRRLSALQIVDILEPLPKFADALLLPDYQQKFTAILEIAKLKLEDLKEPTKAGMKVDTVLTDLKEKEDEAKQQLMALQKEIDSLTQKFEDLKNSKVIVENFKVTMNSKQLDRYSLKGHVLNTSNYLLWKKGREWQA